MLCCDVPISDSDWRLQRVWEGDGSSPGGSGGLESSGAGGTELRRLTNHNRHD
jgi:hypothetical protein